MAEAIPVDCGSIADLEKELYRKFHRAGTLFDGRRAEVCVRLCDLFGYRILMELQGQIAVVRERP